MTRTRISSCSNKAFINNSSRIRRRMSVMKCWQQRNFLKSATILLVISSSQLDVMAGGYGDFGGRGDLGGSASASATASASSFASSGGSGWSGGSGGGNPFLSAAGHDGAVVSIRKDVNLNNLNHGISSVLGSILDGVGKVHDAAARAGGSAGIGIGFGGGGANSLGKTGNPFLPGSKPAPFIRGSRGKPESFDLTPLKPVTQPDLSYVPPPISQPSDNQDITSGAGGYGESVNGAATDVNNAKENTGYEGSFVGRSGAGVGGSDAGVGYGAKEGFVGESISHGGYGGSGVTGSGTVHRSVSGIPIDSGKTILREYGGSEDVGNSGDKNIFLGKSGSSRDENGAGVGGGAESGSVHYERSSYIRSPGVQRVMEYVGSGAGSNSATKVSVGSGFSGPGGYSGGVRDSGSGGGRARSGVSNGVGNGSPVNSGKADDSGRQGGNNGYGSVGISGTSISHAGSRGHSSSEGHFITGGHGNSRGYGGIGESVGHDGSEGHGISNYHGTIDGLGNADGAGGSSGLVHSGIYPGGGDMDTHGTFNNGRRYSGARRPDGTGNNGAARRTGGLSGHGNFGSASAGTDRGANEGTGAAVSGLKVDGGIELHGSRGAISNLGDVRAYVNGRDVSKSGAGGYSGSGSIAANGALVKPGEQGSVIGLNGFGGDGKDLLSSVIFDINKASAGAFSSASATSFAGSGSFGSTNGGCTKCSDGDSSGHSSYEKTGAFSSASATSSAYAKSY